MVLARPFDGLAADYDHSFTESVIGQRVRAVVWRRLDQVFEPGDRVLELNCGTGEDAIYLGARGVRVVATDNSIEMLGKAHAKVARARLANCVEVAQLDLDTFAGSSRLGVFDGALSNFGGLNCVDNLPVVARQLARRLRPGARALLCLMGPTVPWEWGWFLARGQPAKAVRRLQSGGVHWRGLNIRYPSIRQVRRDFADHFIYRRVAAIGALVPPTFAESWAARHPRVLDALDRIERRVESVWPLPRLADHFLIEFERRPQAFGP